MTHRKTESARELSPRKTNGGDSNRTNEQSQTLQGAWPSLDEELESRGVSDAESTYADILVSLRDSLNAWYSNGYLVVPSVILQEWLTPQCCEELPSPIATYPFLAMVLEEGGFPSRVVSLYYDSDFPPNVSNGLLSKFCNDHGIFLMPIRLRIEYSETYAALSFFEQTLHSFPNFAGKFCCQICQSPLVLGLSEADRALSRLPSLICSGTQRIGEPVEAYCSGVIMGLDEVHDIIRETVALVGEKRESIFRRMLEQATKEPMYVDGLANMEKLTARYGVTVESLEQALAPGSVE